MGYQFFVGIDWASKAHEICVIDKERSVVERREVIHSSSGLAEMVDWLVKLCKGDISSLAVAIEVPRGAVVECILEREIAVFSINPKQLDRFRDRHTVAGAKDDRRDAFVLADSLRTDEPCFRKLKIDEPEIIQIREMSRLDDELRDLKYKLTGRLWSHLKRFFPQLVELCPSCDEPWFWSAIDLAFATNELPDKKLFTEILRGHRIVRLGANEILKVLRTPKLNVAPGTIEAATLHIRILIEQLQLVERQRRQNDREIRRSLQTFVKREKASYGTSDTEILLSMPGVGHLITATLLAESSQAIKERDYEALRAHAGIAPVTKRSGNKCIVIMRRACNLRLRNALYHWARVSMQRDMVCKMRYAALRARGHTHPRATRALSDSVLRVFFAMLRNQKLYDPSRRGPQQEVAKVQAG